MTQRAASRSRPKSQFDPYQSIDQIPYEELARLRATGPVVETESGWIVVQKDAVEACTHDLDHLTASARDSGIVVPEEEKLISEIQEPRHGRVRRLLNSAIAHHKHETRGVAPAVRSLCEEALPPLLARGGGELIREFIAPIPIQMICQLIGAPKKDWERLQHWTDEVVEGSYPRLNRNERGEGLAGAHPEFVAYLDELIAMRRRSASPPEDMITRMIQAEMEGHRLSDVEIRTQLAHILIAGNETTRNHIGSLLYRLISDPDLMEQVRTDHSIHLRAIDESLRLDPPVPLLIRDCTRSTDAHGVPMREGDKVFLSIASANRDERHYPDPHVFRFDRPKSRDHVTFGSGPHICPGSSLARLESRVVLEIFLSSVRHVEFAEDFRWQKIPVFWANGPRRLDVRLEG